MSIYDRAVDAVLWKDEGRTGPVWVRRGGQRAAPPGPPEGDRWDPVRVTRVQAKRLAAKLRLPLYEV